MALAPGVGGRVVGVHHHGRVGALAGRQASVAAARGLLQGVDVAPGPALAHTSLFLGMPPLVANLIVAVGGTALLRLLGLAHRPAPPIERAEFEVDLAAAATGSATPS